jgi:putative (di)nucleoside polyphosphate hydrolase
MSETEFKYRDNVAAILRNPRGEILVCERLGVRNAWQFPQGGIDEDESPEEALVREVWEEIGVPAQAYRIVERRGPYRYLYGKGKSKRGFHGKVQFYFLCDCVAKETPIDVEQEHPEFRDYRWIRPEQFEIQWLPEMKREVYTAVFADFFGVKIAPSA